MDDEDFSRKLRDAMVPGCMVTFEPSEAQSAGAFVEDALSEADARDSAVDLVLIHGVK